MKTKSHTIGTKKYEKVMVGNKKINEADNFTYLGIIMVPFRGNPVKNKLQLTVTENFKIYLKKNSQEKKDQHLKLVQEQ